MKLEKIVQLNNELTDLLTRFKSPILSKFQLNKLLEAVSPDTASFNKLKDDYIKEHGTLEPNMGRYFIPSDGVEKFQKEMNALLEQEVEIKLPVIKLSVIEKIEDTGTGNFPVLFSIIEE